jgi:Tol biopolymer transport system component
MFSGCAIPPPPSYLETADLSPYTQYQTFDTEHFRFIYPEGYFAFTEKAAIHYEHAHTILQPILKWQPRGRTTILITDNSDSANGFTMPLFRVGMVLIATPPETWFSTAYTEDWIKLLVFHEYVHFLNIDPTSDWMEGLRLVFGDAVRPNGFWPPWMLEGLAVYFETRTSNLGRGRSPYYEGILRAFVNEGKLNSSSPEAMTLDRLNGDYPWFPGGESPYLFGYHLWEQLSRDRNFHADPERAMGDLSMNSSSRVPYFIEGNLEKVMHKNWSDYWYSFLNESRLRFQKEIDAVKSQGETPHEVVAASDYQALGGTFSPDGNWLAYTESSLDDRTRLIVKNIKTGEKKRLDEKILGVGLAFTADSRYVIYSALVREHSYDLFSDLFAYDLIEDTTHQLTHGKRAKDPVLSQNGTQLAWLSVERGTAKIEAADFSLTQEGPSIGPIKSAFVPKPFSILSSPRFSGSGEILFSNQELGSKESFIQAVNPQSGTSRILLRNGFMNRNPVEWKQRIFFVSNETGIENIHELKNGKSERITNVITGTAFPFFSPNGELYGDLLTSQGYQIVKFTWPSGPLNSGKLASFQAPEPLEIALNSPLLTLSESNSTSYSPWASLTPRAWSPIAALNFGSQSGTSIQGAVYGFDSTGKHQYELFGGYHFLPKTVDGGLNYTLYSFRPVIDLSMSSMTTNIGSDLAGSLYRRTHEVSVRFSYPLFWARSTLTPSVAVFNRWNRVRELGTDATVSVPDFQFTNAFVPGFGAGLRFTNARSTRLGFMPEMGEDVSLVGENRFNPGNDSIAKYLASWKHYFGFGEHSVLRSKTQWFGTTRSPETPLTSTDLAGKNPNDSTDRGETLSLSQTTFRGYSDFPTSDLHPRQFGIGALDFHFPISKSFSGLDGTKPVFWSQIHGFVFSEALYLRSLRGTDVVLPSFGGGFSLDTTLLLRVPMRFNVEFQHGTRKDFGGASIFFLSVEPGALI